MISSAFFGKSLAEPQADTWIFPTVSLSSSGFFGCDVFFCFSAGVPVVVAW